MLGEAVTWIEPDALPVRLRDSLRRALIVTRREVRDSLRDWRIVVPIVILTLFFPFLMDFTAHEVRDFVTRYGENNALIAERLNPFLLMIVGFFPISFSLVIALETFVGEKERNSLEPLLSMPISDGELYLGKMLAALVLPLGASCLGIGVYLTGMYLSASWLPELRLVAQMLLLTFLEALVMVAGAVVVSSQTTSVRAANLMASFIIIPMALLIQFESVLMFWGSYDVLWWLMAALVVVAVILIRMGVRIFNREELLAREIDQLKLKALARSFWGYLVRPPELAVGQGAAGQAGWRLMLRRFYACDIPQLLRAHWMALGVVLMALLLAVWVGTYYASRYPVPAGSIRLEGLPEGTFESMSKIDFLPSFSVPGIFFHNVRSLLLAGVLAVFSFGVAAIALLMIPMALIGFFAAEVAVVGYDPWLFLAAFILPHGVIELPAAIVATAFALRIGASLMAPPAGLGVGQGLLLAIADFCKVFFLVVVPMLLLAALIEVNVTPNIVLALYGKGAG